MALVRAVSKVVNEKILCVAERNAWILPFLCAGFSLGYIYTYTDRALLFPKRSLQVLKKNDGTPVGTIDRCVHENGTIAVEIVHRQKNTVCWFCVCRMFLCPDFLRSFEDAPRFANLIIKLMQYVHQHHHMACGARFSAHRYTSWNCDENQKMKDGSTISLVSLC